LVSHPICDFVSLPPLQYHQPRLELASLQRAAETVHQRHDHRALSGGIIEQLTTLPGSEMPLRLEIDAEVPSGLDRSKVRTLLENANTLNFIDKVIK
jgi:hypothetical protein